MRNSRETNPEAIQNLIGRGEYVVKELEALYALRKYRAMKKRYYDIEKWFIIRETKQKWNSVQQNLTYFNKISLWIFLSTNWKIYVYALFDFVKIYFEIKNSEKATCMVFFPIFWNLKKKAEQARKEL